MDERVRRLRSKVLIALNNGINWNDLNIEDLEKILIDPEEVGRQLTLFIKNGGKVYFEEVKVIKIDRSVLFDPETFIDHMWSIEEQDLKSIALTEINLTEVTFDSILKKGEKSIKGEDRLKRLKQKTNSIRLDAGVFKKLWENQNLIPEKWKEQTNGDPTFIFFDGTIVRNSRGNRCVLYLCWSCNRWNWDYSWLERDWSANNPSAVLDLK